VKEPFLKTDQLLSAPSDKLAMQAYGEPPSIRQSQDFLFSQLVRDLNSILISSSKEVLLYGYLQA
jgi:hypothetical protein